MKSRKLIVPVGGALVGMALMMAAMTLAQPAMDGGAGQPAAGPAPAMKLPPGWTEADMQACMLAATPGKMQQQLTQSVGSWEGEHTMWMYPGAEPMKSPIKTRATAIMGGRFVRIESTGDMPGMGPFTGEGLEGYDNVAGKFVGTWIDNYSSGIMTGTGQASPDGKVLTWNYIFSCPITKTPMTMRQVETDTSPDTKTLDMFGPDPKTGKEFQMMHMELHRIKAASAGAAQP